jgi:hypothetical protein
MTIAVDIRRTEELSRTVLREHSVEVMERMSTTPSQVNTRQHDSHSLNRSLPSGGNSSVK